MNNKSQSNAGKNLWTPKWAMAQICHALAAQPDLDVCACRRSAVCKKYITEKQDALKTPWEGELAWCNPPWADPTPFIIRAWEQLQVPRGPQAVWFLLPAKPETKWFRLVHGMAAEGIFFTPRLNYYSPDERRLTNNAPFGSVLFILYRDDKPSAHTEFSHMDLRRPKGAIR